MTARKATKNNKLPKRKGGNAMKAGKTTLKQKDHVAGRPGHIGHEERLAQYGARAVVLKGKGYYLFEIANTLAEEFNMERVPAISTVSEWLSYGNEQLHEQVEKMKWQLRFDQWNELDALKMKWMTIATAEALEVRRWKMIEGSLQPELDENAIKEQIDATNAVVKIMARQAKLFGLDLQENEMNKKEGPKDIASLQLWINAQIVKKHGGPAGAPIEMMGTNLTLSSGIPDDDEPEEKQVQATEV